MGVRQIVAVVLSVAIIVGAVVWAYMAATTVENGSQHTVKRTPLSESYHFAKNKDISTKTSPSVPPTTSPEAPTNQPESTGKSEDLEHRQVMDLASEQKQWLLEEEKVYERAVQLSRLMADQIRSMV